MKAFTIGLAGIRQLSWQHGPFDACPEVTERQVVLDAQEVLTDQAFVKSVIAMLKDTVGQ